MAINWPQLLVWKGTSKMRNLFFFWKKDQNIVTLARISQHLIFECDPSYPSITQNRAFYYIFSIGYLKILFKPFLTSWTNQRQTRKLQTLYPTSTPQARPQGFSPKNGWRPTHFLREKPWGRGYPPPTPSQPLWDVNEEQRISRGKGKWKKKWKRTKAWFLAGKVLLKSVVKNLWGMVWRISLLKSSRQLLNVKVSLRSRRLEVVGTRKNGRARKRHACLPRARPFSLSPTTSKRLLRRLR